MMTDDELTAIEHRLDLYREGNHTALRMLDLADLLTDARLARDEITHLTAELRIATHNGPA
jgi:hypothetical protein